MTATENKPSRRNALLETLSTQFAVFRDYQPLALGIHKVIKERMPELEAAPLRMAMRTHTISTRYLKSLVIGKERFDLDGNADGEITEEQREAASTALRERFKKVADQRKAEEKAKREAQKEEEANKLRQEKLQQLSAHFSKR